MNTCMNNMKQRVISIDPHHRGFGFVVFEGSDCVLDSGLALVRAERGGKNAESLRRLARSLDFYQPDILIVEDRRAGGCRRTGRVRELIKAAEQLARDRGIGVRRVARRAVRRTFAPAGATNKYQIAAAIADRHPELRPQLPRTPKRWESEPLTVSIFDAAAMAWTFFGREPECEDQAA